jgi:hypothetical protein
MRTFDLTDYAVIFVTYSQRSTVAERRRRASGVANIDRSTIIRERTARRRDLAERSRWRERRAFRETHRSPTQAAWRARSVGESPSVADDEAVGQRIASARNHPPSLASSLSAARVATKSGGGATSNSAAQAEEEQRADGFTDAKARRRSRGRDRG